MYSRSVLAASAAGGGEALEERQDVAGGDVLGDGFEAVADAAGDLAVGVAGHRLGRAAGGRGLVGFPFLAAVDAAPRGDADLELTRHLGLAADAADVDLLDGRSDEEGARAARCELGLRGKPAGPAGGVAGALDALLDDPGEPLAGVARRDLGLIGGAVDVDEHAGL